MVQEISRGPPHTFFKRTMTIKYEKERRFMKNWKRFIAACLSVTMVASIPFTAFAESSVSVKELVPKTSSKSETQEETDLEKILSQEKPYEYFSGLKDQEKLLDACKDEELFQLKEYMKYAYIHESDLKNRQSLDAYLLISEEWRKRNVTFDIDEQEKLLQLPEKAKVYGTKFEGKDEEGKSVERTVKDFSTYMEYLQGIKKFDVPKYMEILSAFDEVKTEEDLAKAKEAFVNFEEEIYGFDEQKKKPVKEELDKKEESSDTKPDKKPAKEASDKEQDKVPVKEDSAASTKPESLPEKPSKEEIKNPKDENSSEEKPEKEQLDESKVEESKNPSEEESSELNQLESGDDKIDENQEHKPVMNAGTWTNKEKYSKREIAKRKGLAKKLGLTEKIDEYGFLPDDYFNGKSDADIEKMPENELMNVASEEEIEDFLNKKPNPDERAGYDILQNRVNVSYSDGGGTHRTGLYTIYDRNAFCIQHSKTNPWVGNAGIHYSDPQVSTNMNLRKVLYYGYGGPEDIGWPAAKTAMAASEANGYDFGGSYGDAYLAEMAAKPAPPEHFEVQVVHCQVSPPKGAVLQDLAMWRWGELKSFKLTLNPNGGVSNGNTGAFTLSPDVIIGYGNWWDIGRYTPTRTGYTFNGWYNAPSGGTKVYNADGTNVPNTAYWDGLKRWIYRGNLTVYAQWTQNTYTNGISHWASGFRHGEGTNGSKDSINLANTSFSANVGSSYAMDASKATRIPNGYRLNTIFGTSAISGSWGSYNIGTRVTQKSYGMWYEYYYVPNTYSISYNLAGGKNHTSNPSSYNILYGVTLQNPTRTGYTFAGWYEGNTRVYGINQGANASFSSASDMYNKLAGRKTGNVTLTARWTPNTYTNSIWHWAWGFNGAGNNSDGSAFQIGETQFSAINGNSYILDANRAISVPHGFYLDEGFGTSSIDGTWKGYPFGTKVTQKAGSMSYQYDYRPNNYSITYNLDGGTNDSRNPSSYNVLYGKTLYEPTKSGYTFRGWKEELFRAKDAVIYSGASRNGETFTFTNSTSGNTFTASKVQVWTNDFGRHIAQPVTAESGTNSNVSGSYTHNESTGNYMIRVAANGSTQDYSAPVYNIYLEKGKTYTFTIGSSTVSSNKATIGNVSVKGDITGINAGKSVPNPVTMSFINNELPTRKIGDVKLTATWERTPYLDVNTVINGTEYYHIPKSYFTFDVYINGKQVSNDVDDYWTMWPLGTKYEIKDIKPASNVKYLGPTKGTSVSGTITETGGNIAVWLKFVTTQTNTLHHKYWGLANKEGSSNDGKAFLSRTDTFKQDFGTEFTLGEDRKDPNMPNGFELNSEYYSQSDSKKFPVGTTVTQKDEDMVFYYDYLPIDYKITYDLGGGTNNAANPSTYDVLYGVSLKAPTRPGYKFAGWYQGETKITGINEGKNADFVKGLTDSQKFYDELNKRQTGNVTLTAKWTPNKLTVRYHLNGGTDVASDNIFGSGDPAKTEVLSYPTTNAQYGLADITTARVTPPTGYRIKGTWNTKADGSGKSFDFTTIYKLSDLTKDIETGDAVIDLYAQWTENVLTVNYYSNYATKGFTGALNEVGADKNVLVRTVTYPATADCSYGLHDYYTTNAERILARDFYTGTGNWGTKTDGGILVNQSTGFKTGMELAKALGVDITTQNATINVYPQWSKNTLTIQYHANGGTLTNLASSEFTCDTEGYLLRSEKRAFQKVTFDHQIMNESNGFFDWNNPGGLDINKVGYIAKKGAEWNTKSDGTGKSFNQTLPYIAKDVTDLSKGSVTLTVYVNWTPKKLVTTFHKNDGSTTTATQTFTYDTAGQKFSDKKWIRTGYTLLGWADSKTATKAQYAILSGVSNAWIEKHYPKNDVYAVWKTHTYTITYEGNGATGGSTPSSNHTYDKPQTLTPNGFHKDGYYFDSWNTKPDGTGTSYQDKEEVKNLTSKDGDTVILHAQWKPVDYKITYKGNGSTGGTEKTHLYNQKDVEANGYAVKTNKGYTDFVRTNHTFMGWYQNSVVDTKAEMAKIYKQGSKLTYSQLLAIHAEQVKKGLVKETDPKVKDILLYAVWDEAPSIDTSNMKKSKFYEGVDVTRADLLNGITASDKIDGSLTSQIIITKIDYSAGKLVNGKKQAAYSQTWANGMPADAKLDTWFMQLDKNDSPVTHTITYQVKDSAGNVTTAKKTIQVVYNEFPVIKATDFQFELKDAQTGKITKDVLLAQAVTNGIISASDTEDGDIKSKIELIDYDANAFKTMKQEGFVPITYRVQDSMGPGGKGKVTLKTVNVNIFIRYKEETVRYVRFINKKYYDLNANLDRAALAGKYDQIALLSVNGGLHPFSVWYTKTAYRELITETFNKTTGTTYVYTKDDIKKMREFVKQHGVGNAKEEDALSKFADIFMTGDYILK